MRTIGGWTIVRKLASGGMGAVYKVSKATDVGVPLMGALKIPLAHAAADERESCRFVDEARMLMALDHPNIVRVLDAGIDENVPYIVMQWVNGIDLSHFRKTLNKVNECFSVPVALHVTAQLLQALMHAHNRTVAGHRLRIIHRDVKPANVLVSTDGHVLLTDFGIASMLQEGTTSGNAHGTPRYMSPEQFRGKPSQQSDVWGVGAVLWELLAGIVFRGEMSSQEVLNSLADQTIVALPPFREDFTIPLMKLLARLLAARPEHRIATAEEALLEVERCAGYGSATAELRSLMRRIRNENSGFTELFAVPAEGASQEDLKPEVDIIFASARIRRTTPPASFAPAPDVEVSPRPLVSVPENEDTSDDLTRCFTAKIAAAVEPEMLTRNEVPPEVSEDDKTRVTMQGPSVDPKTREHFRKEGINIPLEPEPDAPTFLRRPTRLGSPRETEDTPVQARRTRISPIERTQLLASGVIDAPDPERPLQPTALMDSMIEDQPPRPWTPLRSWRSPVANTRESMELRLPTVPSSLPWRVLLVSLFVTMVIFGAVVSIVLHY